MAIVITNGKYYMRFSSTGKILRTLNIDEARKFYNVNVASRKLLEKMEKLPEHHVGRNSNAIGLDHLPDADVGKHP